jgi:hypothetical protein
MNLISSAAIFIVLCVSISEGLLASGLNNNADVDVASQEPNRTNDRAMLPVNAHAHSLEPEDRADKIEQVVLRIGTHILHVPKNYIDGSDGFQGKFGYLKIRALLPCLLPETPSNRTEFHKDYWDKVIIANIDELEKAQLTGRALLDAIVKDDLSINYLRKYPMTEDSASEDIKGSNFRMFKNDLLSRDVFYEKNSTPLFVLDCVRKDRFAKYPYCQSRSVFDENLLLEYYYSRSYIEQSIQDSLVVDARIKKLFSLFLSPSPEKNYNVNGVCE